MAQKIAGQLDLLSFVVSRFENAGIRFLMTGSLAVASYGYPRATHDIDFVVIIERSHIVKLRRVLSEFGSDFLQDLQTLTDTPIAGFLYSLYHLETGIKIDLWLEAAVDFHHEWDRRHVVTISSNRISLVSPEDLILKKLSWCKQVASERHMRDCIGMWLVQKGKLDETYLFARAKKLGITDLLATVIKTKEY